MTHRGAVGVLVGCAVIWGIGFPLNKMVLGTVTPMLFLAARFGPAAVALSPTWRTTPRETWLAGAALGSVFAVQLALFAAGLVSIPPARSAFLFSVQTPLVPLLLVAWTRHLPAGRSVVRVVVALVGSWLLTKPAGAAVGLTIGDGLTLLSAALAAAYIIAAGHLGRRHDPWRLLAVQFVMMALFGLLVSPLVETGRFEPTALTAGLIVVLAGFSILTFGGQLIGQRLVRPTEAALIFAIEPVAAAAMSYLVYGETFGILQWLGGAMIIGAALIRPSPAEGASTA
ncbi:MAG: DMT family transporter [Gemmatimonadetes bacterium]|nr:DMT family transporter [Gemmatimonadota bacterium]